MKHHDRSAGYQLLNQPAGRIQNRWKPPFKPVLTGKISSSRLIWCWESLTRKNRRYRWMGVFDSIFALAVLSFADARPRGLSDQDLVDGDEFTVSDLFECLRFVSGELRFSSDYLRGRCMKTDITVRKDGMLTLSTRNRGTSCIVLARSITRQKKLAALI